MIPQFPEFKSIELSDREEVEKITHQFPPYSDFNFVSMWCWNIKNEMKISDLNGNLVVRFTDYVTGEPFYSFLGSNKVNETAEALLELSKKEGLKVCLKLVPEDSVRGLDSHKFNIQEDRDNFDYIVLVKLLSEYNTSKTKSKRKAVRNFLKKFTPEVRLLDLSDLDHQKKILTMAAERAAGAKYVIENELLAISRLISAHKEISVLPIGIFIGPNLIGFFFGEVLNKKYSAGHFWRANTRISQFIYAYLMQEKAKVLAKHGCEFINIEQDLGIENLRKWKNSYGTEIFLKKYVITPAV